MRGLTLTTLALALMSPAFAQSPSSPLSDELTVFNPAGAIDTQLQLFEDGTTACTATTFTCAAVANMNLGTEDPAGLYYITAPVNQALFGSPINVFGSGDVSPSNPTGLSDIVGVATPDGGATFVLGFTSDNETQPPAFGPVGGINASEDNGPINVSNYLSAGLQGQGWTASFTSDSDAPEPATLSLIACAGLVGLVLGRRKKA